MLKVENLSFNEMIQNICLMFTPGTITGILGPNGSGKTTFLKTLKKIWTPTSGQVTWNGESLHALSREKMSEVMSLVPQNPQVTFGFTVREFLEMGSYPAVSMNPQLYQQTLTLLDLEMLEDRPITELSGGERQRAYIARSLITEAPVMMLDEPIANLDICHQQSILKLLKEFAQSGKTVILTTHDLDVAESLCDKVAIFSKGGCVGYGEFSETVTPDLLWEVFGVLQSQFK